MNSRKPSRHVSWAHKPNPSFACSPPCNSSVLIDTSAEQKWPPIVDSRKPSRHVFWAHKPNPSFVCSPPNDSSVFIAALTLWPSGQGVGLLSRWGLPAWARIPQVSLAQPPAALQPCVCGQAGRLPALRTTACLQLRSASNELVTGGQLPALRTTACLQLRCASNELVTSSWRSWGGSLTPQLCNVIGTGS